MPSRQIEYREPVTVSRETTVAEAADRMNHEGVGSLLVTEGDQLVGIVTDRDLALRVIGHQTPYDGRIDAVMTCGVVTVPPNATQGEILAVFREHSIRRIPVVDAGKALGIIALDDLLAAAPDAAAVSELAAVVRREIADPQREARLPQRVSDATWQPTRPGRHQARVGDQLVVHSRSGPDRRRDGEILAVHSPAGDPPFRVRWSDDGRTTFIYPGPDAEIRHLSYRPT